MALTIQERLKDLRAERGLTLEQLAEQDLREAHRDDFFSVPERASLVFICKRFRLNYGKLSEEDNAALKWLAGKSDLLKKPIPQRGRK